MEAWYGDAVPLASLKHNLGWGIERQSGWLAAGGGPSFYVRMLVIPRAFELSAAAPNFLKKVAPQIQFTWLLSFEPPGRRVGESGEFLVRWTS